MKSREGSENISKRGCEAVLREEGAENAVLKAAGCPRFGDGCVDGDFRRAVKDVRGILKGYAEKVKFAQVCKDIKGSLMGMDRDQFLVACGKLMNDERLLKVCGQSFDRIRDGSTLRVSIPFGHSCGWLLIIYPLGDRFDVSVERNESGGGSFI